MLTKKRRHGHRSVVFIINFEYISHIALVFPLLTLNKWIPAGSAEQCQEQKIRYDFDQVWFHSPPSFCLGN